MNDIVNAQESLVYYKFKNIRKLIRILIKRKIDNHKNASKKIQGKEEKRGGKN